MSPEAIKRLPIVPPDDPHFDEWRVRAATSDRLARHIRARTSHPHILDLGCGTGWMPARMVRELGATAVGIDCNRSELERGAEAFGDLDGLDLVFGDIFEAVVEEASFDIIIVSAALQYFPDVQVLITHLLTLLKPGGEILIADSPLYSKNQVDSASARSLYYYTNLGFPEMARFYHHHTAEDLADFFPTTLFNPKALVSRVTRKVFRRAQSPFPILSIRPGRRK